MNSNQNNEFRNENNQRMEVYRQESNDNEAENEDENIDEGRNSNNVPKVS